MTIVEIKVAGVFPVAIVDVIDKDLAEFNWFFDTHAIAKWHTKSKPLLMQRIILSRILGRALRNGEFCSLKNLNPFDCRRTNLRLATKAQCCQNRRRNSRNTSGYKGVSFYKRDQKWQAQIQVNGRKIHLGLFDEPEFAYAAYCRAAEQYHGEFARLE